ncbi:MAG: hypothetical protein O7A65_08265 [Proteobacteria bacterium]|nr:hypothetical protein [Pseudomonadota bacterium]
MPTCSHSSPKDTVLLGMDAGGRLDVMQALDPRDNPFGLIVPLGDGSILTLRHWRSPRRRGASLLPPTLQSPALSPIAVQGQSPCGGGAVTNDEVSERCCLPTVPPVKSSITRDETWTGISMLARVHG